MYKQLKDMLPTGLRNKLIQTILDRRYNKLINQIAEKKSNSKSIFILGGPEHGNLGDHAIMDAEIKFLNDNFTDYLVFEIPFKMVAMKKQELKTLINNDDIVCVTGGGYMGSLWPKNEEFIRNIVADYRLNKVIVFPQTVFYDMNDSYSEKFLQESIEVYNGHSNLTLSARDRKSYDFFEKKYQNANNIFTPDIGLYLSESDSSINREGLLVCLRSDREKITDTNQLESLIKSKASEYNLDISITDTVINRPVTSKDREVLLQKKLNEFRSSKLVVTDRLHGMIFATVTSTPCIAIDNRTGKVKGVYNWIQDQNYVKFLDSLDLFEESFDYLMELENSNYENEFIREKYSPLIKSFTQ